MIEGLKIRYSTERNEFILQAYSAEQNGNGTYFWVNIDSDKSLETLLCRNGLSNTIAIDSLSLSMDNLHTQLANV